MHIYRSHTCGALRLCDVGQTTRISGWVHRKRDHGGLLFIDLRDNYGITQCVIEPNNDYFAAAEVVRPESVIRIEGVVLSRDEETINRDLPTGQVEVRMEKLDLLSAAEELPLQVFGDQVYPEETRLRYRFLDLRRPAMHRNILLRSKIISSILLIMLSSICVFSLNSMPKRLDLVCLSRIESDDAPALSSDFSFLLFFLKSNTEIVFYHDIVILKVSYY